MASTHHAVVDDGHENDEILKGDGINVESYTLEALKIIREAQQQHGLRHGDHQRYRQYCARRIRRIRKSLHFPQGNRHKVQPKKLSVQTLKDARFLLLPLIDAERSWSYAMQLKSESNTEPRKKFHMVSRLRKAVQHSELLVSLCESDKCDARTKLEAQAYHSWMKACLQFDLENWKAAIELYTNAKTIYEKLAGALVDETKEMYLQKCEEISPNIRYCAYNIGDESAIEDLRQMRLKSGREDMLTSRLDELIEKTREKQSATLSEVTWRSRTVPVKNEQVRVFLLSIQDSEKQLSEAETSDSKLSIYESLLKELIDAQQALREELKEDPAFKAIIRGQPVEGKVPNAVYLHTYLAYLRLTKTIDRNLLMIESLKVQLSEGATQQPTNKKMVKPQDIARLYDIVVQNLQEIPHLPGLDDDDVICQEVAAQILGYKAFRCFYLAQTYVSMKKWREGTALYEKVLTYADDALASYKMDGVNHVTKKQEMAAIEELKKDVDGLKYSCRAASVLDIEDITGQTTVASRTNNKPLADRLEEYFEDPNLASKKPNLTTFPPEFQPIPCKPLFFDLALSFVEFPPLDEHVEQKKQAGGITGFVKGWLWGGGKK